MGTLVCYAKILSNMSLHVSCQSRNDDLTPKLALQFRLMAQSIQGGARFATWVPESPASSATDSSALRVHAGSCGKGWMEARSVLLSAILLSCIFIASPCLPPSLLKPPPNPGPHHTKGGGSSSCVTCRTSHNFKSSVLLKSSI